MDDLTTRARIRDAALAEFARLGVAGASIRGIAKAAGVSPGLVQHHFGTKDGLRAACDRHVFDTIRAQKEAGLTEGRAADPDFLGSLYAVDALWLHYLARALVDGGEAVDALFDHFVGYTVDYLAAADPTRYRVDDPATRDLAAVMNAMHLGLMALHPHLSRALGADSLAPAALPRVGAAMLRIYAGEAIDPTLVGQLRGAIAALQAKGAPQ